jgi:5-methylcytosine-specific restriction endonuclease McrA
VSYEGRSGRPWARMRALVKREGSHVCWLCGKAIDMGLPYNHKWGWTIDHVLPLSMGGSALDMDNLREAHRSCNSSRGNRDKGPIPKRSREW